MKTTMMMKMKMMTIMMMTMTTTTMTVLMMTLISKGCCKDCVFVKCLVHAACSLAALFIIAKKIEKRHVYQLMNG